MAMRGRKPRPVARERHAPAAALPRCPAHLAPAARREWRRLAAPLHAAGILTAADRGALAAYCQAWARWVEAEEQLARTPLLLRTPSGYVQQSPWLSIANRQLELMGRFMAELGLTPSARSRVAGLAAPEALNVRVIRVGFAEADGTVRDIEGRVIESLPED